MAQSCTSHHGPKGRRMDDPKPLPGRAVESSFFGPWKPGPIGPPKPNRLASATRPRRASSFRKKRDQKTQNSRSREAQKRSSILKTYISPLFLTLDENPYTKLTILPPRGGCPEPKVARVSETEIGFRNAPKTGDPDVPKCARNLPTKQHPG